MSTSVSPLFLGLDLSTQQLKAVLISDDSTVVHESAVHFDNDLPKYGTTNGAIRGPGQGEVTSPVAMWLDAIDLLMERMATSGVDFKKIVAISGAGQQHGSVYWSAEATSRLSALDPSQTLTAQLPPSAFSFPKAPIWQDSSTTRQCRELEAAIGGAQALADLSGSRAYERFTGNQIAKIRHDCPDIYASTSRISLVSSFIPSLFLGKFAPIDASDASGMNLMNILTWKWDARLLDACGGADLRAKLGLEPVDGGIILGTLHPYWVSRYGFDPSCGVAPFTGDNPATVVAASTPGDAILSLGTSTTLLISIPPADTAPARFTTSHLLAHPTTQGASIAMLCYKNGALAREHVRDAHAARDWSQFNELINTTPPGNNGYIGLYFPLPEIIPPNVNGNHFYKALPDGSVERVDAIPEDAHPRAIMESQFLSVRARIAAVMPADAPPLRRLVMTGGSAANPTIRQLAADIFGMRAYVADGSHQGAGTGGAILAKFAWWKARTGNERGTFEEMVAGQADGMKLVATPKDEVAKTYASLVEVYKKAEAEVVTACMA